MALVTFSCGVTVMWLIAITSPATPGHHLVIRSRLGKSGSDRKEAETCVMPEKSLARIPHGSSGLGIFMVSASVFTICFIIRRRQPSSSA